jgi:hypothetical protein
MIPTLLILGLLLGWAVGGFRSAAWVVSSAVVLAGAWSVLLAFNTDANLFAAFALGLTNLVVGAAFTAGTLAVARVLTDRSIETSSHQRTDTRTK